MAETIPGWAERSWAHRLEPGGGGGARLARLNLQDDDDKVGKLSAGGFLTRTWEDTSWADPGGTPLQDRTGQATGPEPPAPDPAEDPGARSLWRMYLLRLLAGGVVLMLVFVWAFWPTLRELVATWNREPDYSHGFLVVPFGIYLMWARRKGFPGISRGLGWLGLVLIVAAVGMRILSGRFYLDPVDGWAIPVWAAGVIWLLGGRRVLVWSLPSVAILFFMVPLPWRAERWVSLPLQGIATRLSCWTLQGLGEPVVAQGHTILLGSHHLEVEQACSGLRIFIGIVALAFAYLTLVRRSWWESVLLMASVVPIALVANSARIVGTGLLFQHVSSEAAQRFSHDVCGWVMIPFAALLFGMVLWYSRRLFQEADLLDVGTVIRRRERW